MSHPLNAPYESRAIQELKILLSNAPLLSLNEYTKMYIQRRIEELQQEEKDPYSVMLKTPIPEPPRSCNRHDNCDEADHAWLSNHPTENMVPYWFHCHDEDCPDCLGC